MATSLFQKYDKELSSANIERRTREAQQWFYARLKGVKRINEVSFLKDPNLIRKQTMRPGYMYHFVYDPKTKEQLPFYDTFPLVLAVAPAPGGFYGLNLHYLHPLKRAAFLDKLMLIASSKEIDEKTKIRLNYNLLNGSKKYKEFVPCFKHYLTNNINSRLMLVPATEWDIAIFLPTEKFQGRNKSYVWSDSKKKILGL